MHIYIEFYYINFVLRHFLDNNVKLNAAKLKTKMLLYIMYIVYCTAIYGLTGSFGFAQHKQGYTYCVNVG